MFHYRDDDDNSAPDKISLDELYEGKQRLMEEICQLVIRELQRQGLSDTASDFLLDHGPIVQSHIQDPQIRASDIWAE